MTANTTTNLFRVRFRPAVSIPHQLLLCQTITVRSETLIWLDGIDFENPVLLPLASAAVEPAGDFNDLVCSNLTAARNVIELSSGAHSVTIMARAIHMMSHDRNLTPAIAVELVIEQATDLLEIDRAEGHFFHALCS